MNFPASYAEIPGITVYDPLAELLGAPTDGLLHYTFADAVKLAGHACPTVAGAWMMSVAALRALYPQQTPQRGQVRVDFAAPQTQGVTGVIASIATLLTGAAGDGGFLGVAGQHRRRDLLRFAVDGVAEADFTRLDTGLRAACRIDLSTVPPRPETAPLLQAILSGDRSPDTREAFARAWQMRVRELLRRPDACIAIELH